MSVLFLNGNLIIRKKKSGVHFYHENILRELINCGVEFKCAFFNFRNKNSQLLKDKNYNWIRNRIVENNKILRIFVYIIPIEFLFGRNDIYVCDGWIPITIKKSKKVAIVHDLMSKIYPENYSFIMKLYLYTYIRQLKKAEIIIAVSETTKADIIKYLNIPSDRIKVIYNGINLNKLIDNKINDICDVDLNNKYFLYIGEMRKNKNLISAIKGFEKYYNEHNEDCYFYIAGNKSFEYENLKQYIKGRAIEKKVVFLGYITQETKIKLYKNAFAFIFVSFYEGFGVPILEAMSLGTPVITSNCSSMKEIANKFAILVEPTNVEEISNALETLLNIDIRNNLIKSGFECVSKYSWKNSAQKLNEILLELQK